MVLDKYIFFQLNNQPGKNPSFSFNYRNRILALGRFRGISHKKNYPDLLTQ
jgi:hypothetical protein